MRLIDADKLLDENCIRVNLDGEKIDACEECDYYGNCITLEILGQTIQDAPTVDAEPVRHGHWNIHETYYGEDAHCSVCRNWICVNVPGNGLPDVENLNYCPFCGAKMDEVTE